MSDRVADCGVMFRHLGIDSSKLLKCTAHVLLCIDHAIDKGLRDTGENRCAKCDGSSCW